MSTLPYQTIKELCIENKLVTPWFDKTKHLGLTFGLSECGYDIRIDQDIVLYPVSLKTLILRALGFKRPSFIIASSIETFNLPNDIKFELKDKSTLARLGLTVQNTIAEPGWDSSRSKDHKNTLTLELINHSERIIRIKHGTPIGQAVFDRLEAPTERSYKGKYQSQPQEPVSAIFED
jgi:dCTP deaminase